MWTWLRSILGGGVGAGASLGDDRQQAIAALLMRAVTVDGIVAAREKELVVKILMAHYGLQRRQADTLMAAAKQGDDQSGDLQATVDHAARGLDAAGKLAIIDMLWQISMADDHIHEFEDSLVWRVADMLGVPVHERIASRRRAGQMIGKS